MTTAVADAAALEGAQVVVPPANTPAPAAVQITPNEAPKSAVDAAAEDAAADAQVTYTYTQTENAGLNLALEFVGNRGIGPEDPSFKAAMQGDFSLLKAKLASMGTQASGYAEYVALAEDAWKANNEAEAKKSKAATAAALAVFGEGEQAQERFVEVAAYVKANASDAEVSELNTMLKGSPLQARAAAALMLSTYSGAKGVTRPMTSAVKDNAAAGTDGGVPSGKLSAKDFAKAVQALPANIRNSPNLHNTPQYKALAARL